MRKVIITPSIKNHVKCKICGDKFNLEEIVYEDSKGNLYHQECVNNATRN